VSAHLQGRAPAQEPGVAVRYLARHGGQTSRAPVPRSSNPGLGGEGTGDSLDARSRTRGCGLGRSRSPIPRTAWWPGRPSVGRPSEVAEQGVLRAPRAKVRGQRVRARTPCSSFLTLGRCAAARLEPLLSTPAHGSRSASRPSASRHLPLYDLCGFLSASSPSANSAGRLPGTRPRGRPAPSARYWCRAPWRPSCRRRAGGPCPRGPCRSPRR